MAYNLSNTVFGLQEKGEKYIFYYNLRYLTLLLLFYKKKQLFYFTRPYVGRYFFVTLRRQISKYGPDRCTR